VERTSTPDVQTATSTTPSLLADVRALQAISGRTVYRIERDPVTHVYAAHMIRPDGSFVTARFDGTLTITGFEHGLPELAS
jgi:hypothetical protein